MKKSLFVKILVLAICAAMLISLFACDKSEEPTEAPTDAPTEAPTDAPTEAPTDAPTEAPTDAPTEAQTDASTEAQTDAPTEAQTDAPTEVPTDAPTEAQTDAPTETQTDAPTEAQTDSPTEAQTDAPTETQTGAPTDTETETETETETDGGDKVCENNSCKVVPESKDGIKYVCSVCGEVYEPVLDADVNFYSAPGQTANNWNAGNPGGTTATINHELRVEDGKVYEHIRLDAGASLRFDNGTVAPARRFLASAAISGGSGRYLVIRMRTHNINVGMRLMLNSNTSSEGNNAELNSTATNSINRSILFADGEWQTYVIDLKTLAHPLYNAEDKNVTKIAVGLYLPSLLTDHNASMDLEYLAICDGWEEIDKIVEEDTVMLSAWGNDDPWKTVSTEDGELPIDTEGEYADKVIYQKTGKDLYVYVRSPYTGKYTMYRFGYKKNDGIAFEGWSIISTAICDTKLNPVFYTMPDNASEVEGALQERLDSGAAAKDFISGGHGDEKYRSIKITVDGKELDLGKDYQFTACESVCAFVESDVFRCESDEKVFYREKTLTWTEAGLEIKNRYEAVAKITIERPALSMMAIYVYNSGIDDIVDKRWDNITNTWTDIPYFDSNPYSLGHQSGMTKAELKGKIYVSCEMTEYSINGVKTACRGWFNYDGWSATNRRVKIYLEPFMRQTLAVGDVITCTSMQSIFDCVEEEEPDVDVGGETDPSACTHDLVRKAVEDDWVISCSKCDYKYEYGLKLSAAQRIYNPYELGAYSNMGTTVVHTDSNFDTDGPEYMRITNITAASSQLVLNSNSTGERYVVIKFRIGKNGLGQTKLQFYAPSNLASGQNYGHAGFGVAASEDNEWHTVVIDLAARVAEGGYNTDADGQYNLASLYLRPYGNKQAAAIESKTAYVDIAYIAICDDLSDVSDLVGEETYEWSLSDTENEERYTDTHAAVDKTE